MKSLPPALTSSFGFLAIAVAVLLHLMFAKFPSVNLEYAFADAAGYFSTAERWRIDQYFSLQANTLGMPYAVALLGRLLPGNIEALTIARALVAASIPLLALGIERIGRSLGRNDSRIVLVYVLLNPLVWIYAGRATADFLPVAVGLFAISLTLERSAPVWRWSMAGLIFALACVLKYHAAFLLIPMLSLQARQGLRNLQPLRLAVFLAPVVVLLPAYIVFVHQTFGFWLTPPEFQVRHQFSPLGLLSNAICYAGYLTLLTWPTLILLPELRAAIWRRRCLALLILTALPVAGAFLISDNGEMNFGPLDQWLPLEGRTAIFTLCAFGLVLPLIPLDAEDRLADRARVALWLAAVGCLLILSFTRPAQRYLLFIIPFVSFAIPPRFFSSRRLLYATLLLFCVGNAFVEYSRWCTGTASARMVDSIRALGLLEQTDPGAVLPHAGSAFRQVQRGQLAFTIVAGSTSDALVTTRAGLSIFDKSYSLVPRPHPTNPSSGT